MGRFHNSEAAYQSMKWWQHEPTRSLFEQCKGPGLEGGEQAFLLKRCLEKTDNEMLKSLARTDFDGLGKMNGMLHVLRLKWRLPTLKEFLLSSSGMYLVEHSPLK